MVITQPPQCGALASCGVVAAAVKLDTAKPSGTEWSKPRIVPRGHAPRIDSGGAPHTAKSSGTEWSAAANTSCAVTYRPAVHLTKNDLISIIKLYRSGKTISSFVLMNIRKDIKKVVFGIHGTFL